jgi:FkbM family methyltransferase
MKSILRASVNWLPHRVRHRIKHIPGIAALQRWLVARVLSGEPFVHTINAGPARGLRFEVELPLDKAIWSGTYEPEFADAISDGVKQGDVCYDIGGYRGYMSGTMALAGASKVIVFEPLPANQQALQRLCSLNPSLNIEIKPIAVGNTDGSIQLRVMADASMGKLVTSTFQSEAQAAGEIEIAIRRLDSLVQSAEILAPSVMKIDVEGAELDVLEGAANILKASRPIVFIEAHSSVLEDACSRELSRHGYVIRRLQLVSCSTEQTRHLIAFPQ